MKIKESAPDLVTPEMMIADRIAGIAMPSSGNSIWDALGKAFGIGAKSSGGLGARFSTPHRTRKLKKIKNRLLDQYVRGEEADRFGVRLPSLRALGPAQRGIATAGKFRNMSEEQYVEEAVDGATKGPGAVEGDTQFVDDKGWPVTLKQILGSRLLTNEMYEKASIQNVSRLINVRGGSQQQNEELKYMFQRMMLEGFIRGVDITKELERQGGLDITIGKYETIGVHKYVDGQPTVIFKDSWWNSKGDADKYTLFIHEVGHSLLNASHENDRSKKTKQPGRIMTPIYAGSVLRDYNNLMDGLFKESTSYNRINVQEQTTPQQFDPSWFPSLSEDVSGIGGTGGTTAPKEEKSLGNTIVTPTVYGGTPSNTQPSITAGNGPAVANLGATPIVGGELSQSVQTPTKSFAAGMADLSSGGVNLQAAGALLKSG